MSTNNNSLSPENQKFVEFLCEELNFHYSELLSPLLADEDRLPHEEALKTALDALSCFE